MQHKVTTNGVGALPKQIVDGIWPASNERGYTIDERPARSPRRLKVIGIGAGVTGITLAFQVKQSAPNVDLIIYDQADQVGGNWYWNRYPGVACDNAGVTYQFINKMRSTWANFYSKGEDILEYLQDFVEANGSADYFRLSTRVIRCQWDDETSEWTVTLQDMKTLKIWTDTANVIINGTGPLHHPKWPNLKNQPAYKGAFVHAARYPKDLDLKGKKVAVLGTGSTGVQIIPAILQDAGTIYHWIRQPTYIIPREGLKSSFKYTKEQQERFARDPEYYLSYRKALESEANAFFKTILRGSEESVKATENCVQSMRKKLETRPDIAEKLIPKTFSVGCRRPTPAPGYLEALCEDKVTTFLDEMQEMTERGFIDHDGVEHEVDVFICATGYDTSYVPHFPIISRGVNLQDKWTKSDPDCYLSLASPGFPNFFFSYGPWGPAAHGSAIPIIEILIKSFLSWIGKLSEEQISSMEPREEAAADFLEHSALYLQRTVFLEPCSSWWKVTKSGLPMVFPGTRLSFIDAISRFRPEDWVFRYQSGNRFRCWGNGFDPREVGDYDDTYYLGLINGDSKKPDFGTVIADNNGPAQQNGHAEHEVSTVSEAKVSNGVKI